MEVGTQVWIRDPEDVWTQGRIHAIQVCLWSCGLFCSALLEILGESTWKFVNFKCFVQKNDKGEVVFRVTVMKTGVDRAVTVSSPFDTKSTAARPTSLLEFDDIKLCNIIPEDLDPIQAAIAVHDLAQLMQLHEASILQAVHARFEVDCIYTCTGRILLAVNPFRAVPLYGDDVLDMYVLGCAVSCSLC